MWINNEFELSKLYYEQCKNGNDSKEMRDLITDSYWAYMYCKWIKDIPEMENKITDPGVCIDYYTQVKHNRKLWWNRFLPRSKETIK